MKKDSRKMKTIKGLMVGAVALTPVLAVGVNVEKASAADADLEYANYIKALYNTPILTANRTILTTAHTELMASLTANDSAMVKTMLDSTIVANSPKQNAAVGLVTSLFETFSPTTVDSNFSTKFQSFKTSNKTNVNLLFGSSIDEEDLGEYAIKVHEAYFDIVKTMPKGASTEAYIGAYGVALASFPDDKVYIALSGILNNETVIMNALKTANKGNLKTALEAALPLLVEALNQVVTEPNSNPNPNPNPGNGEIVDNGNGEISTGGTAVEKNPQAVIDIIQNSKSIEELVVNLAPGSGDVSVPATIFNALENKNPNAVLVISSDAGSYSLPVSAVDLPELAKQLNVTSAELVVTVKVVKVSTPTQVTKGFEVLSSSIEFEVSVAAPNGKTIVLNVFPQPVERSITSKDPVDALTTVGVTVVDGVVRSVPTYVEKNALSANLYRAGNSTYTLVENFKTFKDVDKGANWSEANIEKLASRMIVNGTTATTFDPKRAITRGEFAAILARGLGLVSEDSNVKFKDVSPKQAFNKNGEIAAVVEAGIASGYNQGEFRPYQEINRGEAAIMISKAINYIGKDKVAKDESKHISSFKDYNKIGATMRPHVEKVLQAGYINGYSDNTYKSLNQANRAEVAKILYSFLNDIEFIN